MSTTFPRPDAPTGSSFSEEGYRILIAADSPLNCFPSGHISVPTLMLWGLYKQYPSARVQIPLLTTFALLFMTILTTRQHYILDLIGGMMSGGIGVAVSLWWERRRNTLGEGVQESS